MRSGLSLASCVILLVLAACRGIPENGDVAPRPDTLTDPRDGKTYAVVTIGGRTWMAENLRYAAPGSWANPYSPSAAYGRMYDGVTAQTACPDGWRLPSDGEWNELEIALGLRPEDATTTGWRGAHGTGMKSVRGWIDDGDGTNASGFNVLPAGYYHVGEWQEILDSFEAGAPSIPGLGGLGTSAGYWSSADADGTSWVRFLGAPLAGVNRMAADINDESGGLLCRCVQELEKEGTVPLFRKKVSLEHQLERLAELGLVLNSGVDEAQLTTFEDRKSLEATPYKGLVEVMGMELEEEPYTPICNPLWMCDYERIEDHGAYVEVLQRLELLTAGALGADDVRDFVDVEEGVAWLEFDCDGERVRWELLVDDDWLDPTIFVRYDDLLAAKGAAVRIYSNHTDYGQVAFIAAFTSDQKKDFDELTRVKLAPLPRD